MGVTCFTRLAANHWHDPSTVTDQRALVTGQGSSGQETGRWCWGRRSHLLRVQILFPGWVTRGRRGDPKQNVRHVIGKTSNLPFQKSTHKALPVKCKIHLLSHGPRVASECPCSRWHSRLLHCPADAGVLDAQGGRQPSAAGRAPARRPHEDTGVCCCGRQCCDMLHCYVDHCPLPQTPNLRSPRCYGRVVPHLAQLKAQRELRGGQADATTLLVDTWGLLAAWVRRAVVSPSSLWPGLGHPGPSEQGL